MDSRLEDPQISELIEEGRFAEAASRLMAHGDRDDPHLWIKVGRLHKAAKQRDQAVASFRKAAALATGSGRPILAIGIYDTLLLPIAPELVSVHVHMAELYNHVGLVEDAVNRYMVVSTLFERHRQPDRAREILTRLVEIQPGHLPARLKLAELLQRDGDKAAAAEQLGVVCDLLLERGDLKDYTKVAQRLLFLVPEDRARRIGLVRVLVGQSKAKKALKHLQQLLKTNPRDQEALDLLAEAFEGMGQADKAVSVLWELVKVLEGEGDEASLEPVYRRILTLAPDDREARTRLAKLTPPEQVGSKDPTVGDTRPMDIASLEAGEDVAQEAPPTSNRSDLPLEERTTRLLEEARVYLKYGLVSKAEDHLTNLLALDPSNQDALILRKDILLQRGDTEAAGLVLLRLASLTAPPLSTDYLQEARSLGLTVDSVPEQGDAPGAEEKDEIVREALEEVEFFLQQGLHDDARQILEETMARVGICPELEALLRDIERRGADDARSGSQISVVSERITEDDGATHYDLGIAYMEMGLFRDAIHEFRTAMEADVKRAECHRFIGVCYLNMGQPQEAISWLKRGLRVKGINLDERSATLMALAEAHLQARDIPEARAYLHEVRKLSPDYPGLDELAAKLR